MPGAATSGSSRNKAVEEEALTGASQPSVQGAVATAKTTQCDERDRTDAAAPGVADATVLPLKDANAKVIPPIVETAGAMGEVTVAGKDPFSLIDTRTHMRIYACAQVALLSQ